MAATPALGKRGTSLHKPVQLPATEGQGIFAFTCAREGIQLADSGLSYFSNSYNPEVSFQIYETMILYLYCLCNPFLKALA